MQCHTELTPPTAVTHAVNIPLLGPRANNLVIAKTSLLQIFTVQSTTTEANTVWNGSSSGPQQDVNGDASDRAFGTDILLQRTEQTSKLVLVGEYPIAGTIAGLARVKAQNTKSGGEALIIHTRHAKLSLVEWDPEAYNLSTISIHYYEGEDVHFTPWATDLKHWPTALTVDPSSRCAALKFGIRQLAIVPFRQPDEELVGADYDPDLDGTPEPAPRESSHVAGTGDEHQTPYGSSFVLPLTNLDPSLTQPIHLAFLFEYREPTLGILSSSKESSAALIKRDDRRDTLNYTVLTLELEQRASTTLLALSGLPYDLHRVVPLPLPIGGALLLGVNELVHVDQAGKTSAVAVNEFAKQCSSYPMIDQSDLGLRLEGCFVEQLSNESGDLLLVLNNGGLAVLNFKLDGQTVVGLSVSVVPADRGGSLLNGATSCSTGLGRGRIFLGSDDSDAVLLGFSSKASQMSRKRSHAQISSGDPDVNLEEDGLDDDDEEDDLYGDDVGEAKPSVSAPSQSSSEPATFTFRIHDALLNIAPLKDALICTRHGNKSNSSEKEDASKHLQLVAASGRGTAGGLTILNREIDPVVKREDGMPDARIVWTIHAKKPPPKELVTSAKQDTEGLLSADASYDRYLFLAKANEDNEESTIVGTIERGGTFQEYFDGDFDPEAGGTVEIGTIANGTRIVQVLKRELRCYDSGKLAINALSSGLPLLCEYWMSGLYDEPSLSLPAQPIWALRFATLFVLNEADCLAFDTRMGKSLIYLRSRVTSLSIRSNETLLPFTQFEPSSANREAILNGYFVA